MAFARTILAVLIVSSLALAPIGGNAVSTSVTPVEMSMADQGDMPCCPHCDTQDDFKAAACVMKCAALAGAVLPTMTVELLYVSAHNPLSLTHKTLHGLVTAPPTRPPPL